MIIGMFLLSQVLPCAKAEMDATLLANNSQYCWMLRVVSVCTPCCMLLCVVRSCCAEFETGQTFKPTTPNISFVVWSPKHSATMLDQCAQHFQHCLGHTHALHMLFKVLWVVSFPWCTWVPTLLGVAASVYTPLSTRMQQLPTLLAQECWELLHPFARSLKFMRDFLTQGQKLSL